MRPDSAMPDAEMMMQGSFMLLARSIVDVPTYFSVEKVNGAVVLDELARLCVVDLGVALEDVGDVHGERAVDEDRRVRNAAGDEELV